MVGRDHADDCRCPVCMVAIEPESARIVARAIDQCIEDDTVPAVDMQRTGDETV